MLVPDFACECSLLLGVGQKHSLPVAVCVSQDRARAPDLGLDNFQWSQECRSGLLLLLAQGHFQIMFSWQHCPLFQRRLSWAMRILYSSGVWSYIVGAISTPTFIVIPCITIWFGVFPIVVSRWTALGVTVYYFATNMV